MVDPGSDVKLDDVPKSTWDAARNLCAKMEINFERFKAQLYEFRGAVRREWSEGDRQMRIKNLVRFVRLERNFKHLVGHHDGGSRVPGKPDLLTYFASVISVSCSNGLLESVFNGVTRRKSNLSSRLEDDKSFAIEVVCEFPNLGPDPKIVVETFGNGEICTELSV